MQEILTRIEALDATVSLHRVSKKERFGKAQSWFCVIKGERDGLKIETKAVFGDTVDLALSAAWSLFSPAEKLVEPMMLPAPQKPSDYIEDAVYAPLKDGNGDDIPF